MKRARRLKFDDCGEVLINQQSALDHAKRIALELSEGDERPSGTIFVTEGESADRLFEVQLPGKKPD